MKKTTDRGFVVSLHHDASPDTLHVNLKWQGDHDISAFDLDGLGQVLHCENETENTGWAVIKPSHLVNPGDAVPLQKGAEIVNLQRYQSISREGISLVVLYESQMRR
jgi:hypothetical protein